MTPFRRPGSPYWQIRPTVVVPGEGKVRMTALSTGTRNKQQALKMEGLVRDLPLMGYGDLLEVIRTGDVGIQEVYAAHLAGKLEEVRERVRNPLLADVVAGYRGRVRDDRVLSGLDRLLDLCEAAHGGRGEVRLSFLRDPKNVLRVLQRREAEGLKRNSVRRSLYRAISDLLAYELGKGAKTEIMAEVHFPTEDDERQITVTPDQIRSLLDGATEDLFRCALELALTCGIDRKPLLALEARHFHEQTGELAFPDRKTRGRLRTVAISERAQAALRRAIQIGRTEPADRVFPWSVGQFRDRWDAAREAAGLPWLRFKDLRAVFATAFLQAGGSPKQLMAVMGHEDLQTTLRYVKRLPIRQGREMEATAAYLGMARHLKVEEGEAG